MKKQEQRDPGPVRALLLTEEQARAELGGIGRTKLWELVRSGELRGRRIGRRLMFSPDDLRRFVESLPAA